MRFFVTGATGFIGGRLVGQLRAGGHDIVALVRDPAKAGPLAALGVLLHAGDVTDRSSLQAMRGCDGLFHVAGWYRIGARDSTPAWRVNVEGTRNVLETMRDLGVPRGVYTRTLAVYSDTRGQLVTEDYRFRGTHLTEYDRTKAAAHYDVARPLVERGLPLTIVLPGVVYGPGDTSRVHAAFVRFLRRELPFVPGGVEYCWSHVDDAVGAHLLAMTAGRPGAEYIVAGPRHSVVAAFALAERITGIPAPRRRVPAALLRVLAKLVAPLNAIVPLPEDYRPESLRAVAGVTYLGDNAKARAELGYAPRPLAEGLRETLLFEMDRLGMSPPAEHR